MLIGLRRRVRHVPCTAVKAVGFLRLFLSEIASGVSGKVGFGVSVKGDP